MTRQSTPMRRSACPAIDSSSASSARSKCAEADVALADRQRDAQRDNQVFLGGPPDTPAQRYPP